MVGTPKPAPRRCAAAAVLPAMAAASTNSTRRKASRCTRPIKPVPKIAVRIDFIALASSYFPSTHVACSTPLLNPPRSARLLADHDAVEEIRGLSQALFGREQTIFVLDGEHGIVTKHAQRGDKFGPPLGAVTIAAGAEDPAAFALLRVGFG